MQSSRTHHGYKIYISVNIAIFTFFNVSTKQFAKVPNILLVSSYTILISKPIRCSKIDGAGDCLKIYLIRLDHWITLSLNLNAEIIIR